MKELKKEEMQKIEGGTLGITATMINAIYKSFELIYTVGESLGSFIRRKTEDKMCNI